MNRKIILLLIATWFAPNLQAILSITDIYAMTNVISCKALNSVSASFTSNPFSIYDPFVIGFTDCEILQYIIKNVIENGVPVPRLTTVNVLYVKDYLAKSSDLDYCNLGYYLDGMTPNQFSALIALPYSNFSGSSMVSSVWENAYLGYANFSHTTANNAIFSGIDAPGIIFCYSNLTGVQFNSAYMGKSFFNSLKNSTPTIMTGTQFIQSVLFLATFANAQLNNANFFYCDMDRVDLSNANCSGTNFNNSYGTLVVTTQTNFSNANFAQTDRLYFSLPTNQSPIFNNTIMPDGSVCSNQPPNDPLGCVAFFIRVASELPVVGV